MNMKKVVLFIVLICASIYVSFAQGIKFETGTWEEVLAKSKEENKIIFVDVFTQWCGPCKNVAKNVFPLKEMGDVYNKQFINFQIDAESSEGKEFVKKYPVEGYPTFFYINADGVVVSKTMGGMELAGFVKEAEMVEIYGKYGGIDKMMEAIKNGTATIDMYRDYYLAANEREKPQAINFYLKAMPVEQLIDVDNKLVDELSLYDRDLMIRLIDEVIKVGNSERFATDEKYAEMFNFNIGFSVQYHITKFLNKSIKDRDYVWFNELLDLKERFMAYKLSKFDGDLSIIPGRGLFFATPEYCRLCFMAYNRVDEDEFKVEFVEYMSSLMNEYPLDTLVAQRENEPIIRVLKEKGFEPQLSVFASSVIDEYAMTARNIMNWTDYFWRISPSDKKTKELCHKYVEYAYYINAYNSAIAMQAADLLARLKNTKAAQVVVETALNKQQAIKQPDKELLHNLELKLRDAQNGKL